MSNIRSTASPLYHKDEDRMSCTAPESSAYGRQDPTKLIETVVTKLSVGDAKAGRAIHSREPRMLSLMEARRAQGFLDEDVLLGDLVNQYKIVGNSVAREVAVAWGLAFRDAYEKTLAANGDNNLSQAIEETPIETANPVIPDSARYPSSAIKYAHRHPFDPPVQPGRGGQHTIKAITGDITTDFRAENA
ncbi:DNA-like protein [Emericellopsis cladophorae]|uniref:DNA-like protein n=1 Tax=Emericellopsis cladophorae TaxID=2686198 RepID=A0A9P9Y041_9HYPO|nr:DNA-like protein [Emericellopsis cladophorae]KAI6780743.1 DNA-like protein [Emericellopsis cladophorae]